MHMVDALARETTTTTTSALAEARVGRIGGGGGGGGGPLALWGGVEKERLEAQRAVQLSYTVIPHILLVYQGVVVPVLPSQRKSLGRYASQVLPPLSDWDDARFFGLLPLLAAVLAERNDPEPPLSPSASSSEGEGYIAAPLPWSGGASPYLLDYTMEIEWDARPRSAAVSCFFYAVLCFPSSRGGGGGGGCWGSGKDGRGGVWGQILPEFAGAASELLPIH